MSTDSTAYFPLFEGIHSFFTTPILEIIIINLAFTIIALLYLWSRIQLKLSAQNKIDLEIKKRESFKDLLNQHSNLILGKHNKMPLEEWKNNFAEMSRNILLWGSDKVIVEYGEYVTARFKNFKEKEINITEREIHFAKAVLAFRKGIGYKNRFKKVKPEHIIYIFRIGYDTEI